MKRLALAVLAASAALAAAAPSAQAAQGCGPGGHRGPYGGCRANWGPGPGPVIGTFYPGRGYWYGGRYWGHRYGWRGGWRYR